MELYRKVNGRYVQANEHEVMECAAGYMWRDKLVGQPVFTSPALVREYVTCLIGASASETFVVLYLTNKHCLLTVEQLTVGTIDMATVYPREIARRVLVNNAAAVILAHNHPSGITEPSRTDIALTRQCKDALALIDVRVLDHIIVSQGAMAVSLAELGHI